MKSMLAVDMVVSGLMVTNLFSCLYLDLSSLHLELSSQAKALLSVNILATRRLPWDFFPFCFFLLLPLRDTPPCSILTKENRFLEERCLRMVVSLCSSTLLSKFSFGGTSLSLTVN